MTSEKIREISDYIDKEACREFDAKETYQQLYSKPVVVGSWGAHGFSSIKDKALVFQVNGLLHKGTVIITLGWEDLYSIHLFDKEGEQVGESTTGIYCDMLTDVVDELVETERY